MGVVGRGDWGGGAALKPLGRGAWVRGTGEGGLVVRDTRRALRSEQPGAGPTRAAVPLRCIDGQRARQRVHERGNCWEVRFLLNVQQVQYL